MDYEEPSYSRLNRFEKKRNNTKWLSIFIIVGISLVVLFITIILVTNDNQEDTVTEPGTEETEEESATETEEENSVDEELEEPDDEFDSESENPSDDEEDQDQVSPNDNDVEPVESDDDNVIRAFTSDWAPIPTEQSEPFNFSWDQSESDWQEMMQALELATDVPVDEIYYLWVSGDGPNQMVATFSNSDMTEHYRVNVRWVEQEGFKPEKVEVLQEHDEMDRFES
ncbi:Protein of unknown function [Pelagirhabdus alkalitolerans]|uniref:DUF1510 domain-containing protein n=1 Tax=Pelagirhabdus alkalitolerans TaxID=1612202 RepID=A0A1G6HTA1_9BACI|nr:YrrS family protein [Pelagirhabdus alkalitolerans]SDB97378.1 Protein of unknown function [Pelagirhabdus alkalitolerans]